MAEASARPRPLIDRVTPLRNYMEMHNKIFNYIDKYMTSCLLEEKDITALHPNVTL